MTRSSGSPRAGSAPRAARALTLVVAMVLGCRSTPSRDAASGPQPGSAPTAAVPTPSPTAAPSAAPAPPAAAPAAPPAPAIATLRGVAAPAIAEQVGKLLDAAARSLAGEPLPDPDAVLRFLERSISEQGGQVTFRQSPDEISRGAGALIEARERWGSEAEALLRVAAELVQRAKWGYSSHAAKTEVLRALATLHPSPAAAKFRFHADPGLAKPIRPLACPKADPRWTVTHRARYFEDPTFARLQKTADAALPDGAIRVAVELLAVPVVMNEFLQGGSGEVPPLADSVVIRYGERALGCLFDALADPAAASARVGGNVASLRYNAQQVAARLPLDASLKLYRAALQAGWTDWGRDLPATPEHQALAREIGDGPFLPAFQNPYRVPAPAAAS